MTALVLHAGFLEPGDELVEGVVARTDVDRTARAFGPWPMVVELEDGRFARAMTSTKVRLAAAPTRRVCPTSDRDVHDLRWIQP